MREAKSQKNNSTRSSATLGCEMKRPILILAIALIAIDVLRDGKPFGMSSGHGEGAALMRSESTAKEAR